MQQSKLVRKTERHLRSMSRQLIKIDGEEETLQFVTDTFQKKLYCDFVGVVFVDDDEFILRVVSGNVMPEFTTLFPVKTKDCTSLLLKSSMQVGEVDNEQEDCSFIHTLKKASVHTWFTVPIIDDLNVLGFCVIGFYHAIPLLEMQSQFDEFGRDIALAIQLTREKEIELKKVEGIEWVINNISLDSPFKEKISEITSRAGKGTKSRYACIYLYNDIENEFVFQHPAFGKKDLPEKIKVTANYVLKHYFPDLDVIGNNKLTTLIAMDFKTIGVIHLEDKVEGVYTEEDLNTIKLLSNNIANTLENARLYHNEKENHYRLRSVLHYQQSLVKETLKEESFNGMTSVMYEMFQCPILLMDRFKNVLHYQIDGQQINIEDLTKKIKEIESDHLDYFIITNEGKKYAIWTINSGEELLGYLAIELVRNNLDEYEKLMIEMGRSVFAMQFSKQKLIHDTMEEAKESLANSLLIGTITDKERILQYANLFSWDIFASHRVSILSIEIESKKENEDLLKMQLKKTVVWDFIRKSILEKNLEMIFAPFKEEFALLIPSKIEKSNLKKIIQEINTIVQNSSIPCKVFLGVGTETNNIEDYYKSSEQAYQALNIVKSSFYGENYAFFEELGAYTLLQHLQDEVAADLFMDSLLTPILEYAENSNMDLLHTLRTFLATNSNVQKTADLLFLHRSSLRYRLERIEDLLQVKLNDPEDIFQLNLSIKLYDMKT